MEKNIHRIHDYIRCHTKISDGDKSFFIACILISLKKASFCKIIEFYDTKKYIYDIIKQSLQDFDIDVSVFEFLRNDKNNEHFYHIIKMVGEILSHASKKSDLLNQFYSEFVRYNNTDGNSQGIVLTPPHIVKLMIRALDLKPNDIFLDLCSGTGSFVIEAINDKNCNFIACEYQNKLYSLLKCNMILRDVDLDKNKIIKGDCFEYDFKATKSAINPPYGIKGAENELQFIIKQLESVGEGGIITAIIPIAKLNSNKKNNKYKKIIMEMGLIRCLIVCNPKLFYPNAIVHSGIIIIEKSANNFSTHRIKKIDYRDDGIILKKQIGLIRGPEFDKKYQNIISEIFEGSAYAQIRLEDDWFNISLNYNGDIFDMRKFDMKKLEYRHYIDKKAANLWLPRPMRTRYRLFKLGELFTIKRGGGKLKEMEPGDYPFISATSLNNGISNYVNKYSFEDCITVANNGSVASSFYQSGKFECSSDVSALIKPAEFINKIDILLFICSLLEEFKEKYNYGFKWSISRMKNDEIKLPIDDAGNVNFETLF